MPRPPRRPSRSKSALKIDLSPATRAALESLRDRTDADSLSEVVRRAVALYDALHGSYEVVVRHPDAAERLVLIP